MKQTCFAVLITAFIACHLQAQESGSNLPHPDQKTSATAPQSDTSTAPYETQDIDVPPSFPGGEAALLQFLSQQIRYPEQAKQNNIQGTVALTFIVEKNGAISNITIVRNIGAGCAKEVARVVEIMPEWIPGMADGKPVRVQYTLPVRFRLEDPVEPKKQKQKK